MQYLTLNEFKKLARKAKRIAVFREVSAGQLTPVDIYNCLNSVNENAGAMLEIFEQGQPQYSYLCFEPIESLKLSDFDSSDIVLKLREYQDKFAFLTRLETAEIITNSLGIITYDAIRHFEFIPNRHTAEMSLPILQFNFYAISLTFDHTKQTILISNVVAVEDDLETLYTKAMNKIEKITKLLANSVKNTDSSSTQAPSSKVDVDISDVDFIRMIENAKQYILKGDAFQIVLSRCFKRNYTVSPLAIYQSLQQISPAPFMFYFPTESNVILGASPERLISVNKQQMTVNPIAGTRQATSQNRTDLAAELLNDKKELAEHMMLVDLARNDVGAVSIPGSVKVAEFLQVKHYSHVSHLTSTVTAQLQENYSAFDALFSAFPAGTLTGAPKIRAMQIIDELETSARGLYGGAICRLDGLGNLESCIAIRMATLENGCAVVRAGAGIVYDSIPAYEVRETYLKAQSVLDAIAQAQGE